MAHIGQFTAQSQLAKKINKWTLRKYVFVISYTTRAFSNNSYYCVKFLFEIDNENVFNALNFLKVISNIGLRSQ
jgi:hypothetical protein